MKFYEKLKSAMESNNSLVCVGLDPDITKIPSVCREADKPIFTFNKAIIDATHQDVCAYKPQVAYYAGQNVEDELQMTIDYLNSEYPNIPVIFDSKRGDIGSTAQMYAMEVFERYKADSVTVNPLMGTDTLKPFLDYEDKGVIALCRTSNPSGDEIQNLMVNDTPVYELIAQLAKDKWNYNNNILLVVGATYPKELGRIREICPNIPFLVPGVGAQGGDVEKVLKNGLMADNKGLVINSSRGIIYASNGADYAKAAQLATIELKNLINSFR